MSMVLNAAQTALALPYNKLVKAIEGLLLDTSVEVPTRMVQRFASGASLFVMPALDAQIGITKLISLVPDNAKRGLPTIQGDIVVFDGKTGQRLALLDGPTVTARRTAAVSLLAAKKLLASPAMSEKAKGATQVVGPLLVVGAGVQGKAHLEAFHEVLDIREVWVASRSEQSAQALVTHAGKLGMRAKKITDPNAAVPDCPLIVSCTPALSIVLTANPSPGSFVSAVGAYTPAMAEWSAPACQEIASKGTLIVDTRDADHEAGDLLQAGIDVRGIPCLSDLVRANSTWQQYQSKRPESGSIFFKNCGWAGWDLAAARAALSA